MILCFHILEHLLIHIPDRTYISALPWVYAYILISPNSFYIDIFTNIFLYPPSSYYTTKPLAPLPFSLLWLTFACIFIHSLGCSSPSFTFHSPAFPLFLPFINTLYVGWHLVPLPLPLVYNYTLYSAILIFHSVYTSCCQYNLISLTISFIHTQCTGRLPSPTSHTSIHTKLYRELSHLTIPFIIITTWSLNLIHLTLPVIYISSCQISSPLNIIYIVWVAISSLPLSLLPIYFK